MYSIVPVLGTLIVNQLEKTRNAGLFYLYAI